MVKYLVVVSLSSEDYFTIYDDYALAMSEYLAEKNNNNEVYFTIVLSENKVNND